MHRLPLRICVGQTGRSTHPILMRTATADNRDCVWDLTLVQAWELHAALGAQLARYPAPDLSPRHDPAG
ncbi:hypothetical protein [Streptomyces sp. SID3343]|uniref:hypothetical protein n=1 Tax=Streptomyces sp. SID3343 TaxID=2690260 RepID=UPI00136D35CC|nr:hypothetical protein [Streptomyces sp. SID3343]MYW02517.1 hypothetical protein [Streptomyces sp. SID3343]